MAVMILRSKALVAASGKLPFRSEKQIEKTLEFACASLAEAYKIGAEEAQNTIVNRLAMIPTRSKAALGDR